MEHTKEALTPNLTPEVPIESPVTPRNVDEEATPMASVSEERETVSHTVVDEGYESDTQEVNTSVVSDPSILGVLVNPSLENIALPVEKDDYPSKEEICSGAPPSTENYSGNEGVPKSPETEATKSSADGFVNIPLPTYSSSNSASVDFADFGLPERHPSPESQRMR